MNRESILEICLGITAGLLIVVIAAFRSSKLPSKPVLRRSAMIALLTYAVIAVPVFTINGMTVVGLIALLVVVVLALVGSRLAGSYASSAQEEPATRYVRALVGTGLATVLLIAGGQTLALVGRVDPRIMILVIAVVAAVLVAGQGLVASSRISSLSMWLLVVPILIALALGFMLGSAPVVISPIRLVDSTPIAAILAIAVAVFVLGGADRSLEAFNKLGALTPVRVIAWVLGVILLVVVGLLMFFGGVMFAPSMEFFVVPANIDALPGLAGILLAILTVIFSALVANALAGIGALWNPQEAQLAGEDDSQTTTSAPRFVAIGAAIAVVVALLGVGSEPLIVVTSLLAVATVAAHIDGTASPGRGVIAGAIASAVAAAILIATQQLVLGWASIVATVIVALIAFGVGRSASSESSQGVASKVHTGS